MDRKSLEEKDKRFIWHPFTDAADWMRSNPPIIESGKGAYLFDVDGSGYIDGVSSLWTNVHGHCVDRIDQAVRDQIGKIAHSTLLGLANVPAIEFAAKLAPYLPGPIERIFYSDSGATAVEIALKLAFSHWYNQGRKEKSTFLRFDGAYHGDTLGSVSVGGIDVFHTLFRPLLFDAPVAPYPFCYRCPLGLVETTCEKACFSQIEQIAVENADRIAGIVIEPIVQGASGIRKAPEGFLLFLRELADRTNTLLIVDEVATGFGRTGKMFACEHEGVVPDILAMAKGISGGYLPLAATAVSSRVFDSFLNAQGAFRTFFHGHTYTGNPLACVAGLASLEVFEQENVIAKLPETIQAIENRLSRLDAHQNVGHTRNAGLMTGIELVREKDTKTAFDPNMKIGAKVCLAVRNHGIILRPLGDVIVVNPPLCISPEQIDAIFDGLEKALDETMDGLSGR